MKKNQKTSPSKGSTMPYTVSYEPSPSMNVVSYEVVIVEQKGKIRGEVSKYTTSELFQVVKLKTGVTYEVNVVAVSDKGKRSEALSVFVTPGSVMPVRSILVSEGEEELPELKRLPGMSENSEIDVPSACIRGKALADHDANDDGDNDDSEDDGMEGIRKLLGEGKQSRKTRKGE